MPPEQVHPIIHFATGIHEAAGYGTQAQKWARFPWHPTVTFHKLQLFMEKGKGERGKKFKTTLPYTIKDTSCHRLSGLNMAFHMKSQLRSEYILVLGGWREGDKIASRLPKFAAPQGCFET